jgi:hypothetical protein
MAKKAANKTATKKALKKNAAIEYKPQPFEISEDEYYELLGSGLRESDVKEFMKYAKNRREFLTMTSSAKFLMLKAATEYLADCKQVHKNRLAAHREFKAQVKAQ